MKQQNLIEHCNTLSEAIQVLFGDWQDIKVPVKRTNLPRFLRENAHGEINSISLPKEKTVIEFIQRLFAFISDSNDLKLECWNKNDAKWNFPSIYDKKFSGNEDYFESHHNMFQNYKKCLETYKNVIHDWTLIGKEIVEFQTLIELFNKKFDGLFNEKPIEIIDGDIVINFRIIKIGNKPHYPDGNFGILEIDDTQISIGNHMVSSINEKVIKIANNLIIKDHMSAAHLSEGMKVAMNISYMTQKSPETDMNSSWIDTPISYRIGSETHEYKKKVYLRRRRDPGSSDSHLIQFGNVDYTGYEETMFLPERIIFLLQNRNKFRYSDPGHDVLRVCKELSFLSTAKSWFHRLQEKNPSLELCLPKISNNIHTIDYESLWNPCMNTENDVATNNVKLLNTQSMVIQSVHGSGKSSFVDGILVLQILGQRGLKVAAKKANISVRDNIVYHFVQSDTKGDKSTESRYNQILDAINTSFDSITVNSMVLFDEMPEGTSPEGEIYQITELLTALPRTCTTILTTHHSKLAIKVHENVFPNTSLYYFGFDEKTLEPKYNLKKGKLPRDMNYGKIVSLRKKLDAASIINKLEANNIESQEAV